jgi:hypothetical protein
MAFINYELLTKAYPTGRMKENVRLLKDFDTFHCLLAGNAEHAKTVKMRLSGFPKDFLKWLDVCDGGMLFDTAMLTLESHDAELNLPFETYSNYCNAELRKGKSIADDWFVFAVAVHSDVFFFDMSRRDGKVYQWDIEEHKIYAYWHTFEDWLGDQIHEAIGLIADGLLYPMVIKMETIGNERQQQQ